MLLKSLASQGNVLRMHSHEDVRTAPLCTAHTSRKTFAYQREERVDPTGLSIHFLNPWERGTPCTLNTTLSSILQPFWLN